MEIAENVLKESLISVIIPVYNVENYLEQCVKSVKNQTYKNLEIILVDDGSTDNSFEICEKFAAADPRIKLIKQENSGVSVARNQGILTSKGEYITFLDSDDWLESAVYEQFIDVIASYNPDVAMCDFSNATPQSRQKITTELRKGYFDKQQIIEEIFPTLIVTEDFGRLPIVSACTCVFNAAFIKKNKITFDSELRYGEDYLFMAKVMNEASSFYYLKDSYYYNYRQYEISRSKKFQKAWWPNFKLLNLRLKHELLPNKDFDFSRQVDLQLIHSALFVGGKIMDNKEFSLSEKHSFLTELFEDPALEAALKSTPFKGKSYPMKLVLQLIKFQWVYGYILLQIFLIKRR